MAKLQAAPPARTPTASGPRASGLKILDHPWLAALGLAVLVVAVFGKVAGFGFVHFDDDHYVYQNPQVSLGLSWQTVQWAFSGPHYGNYNPLTWLSHLADVTLFALEPSGHHLHNLALHLANALLVLAVLRRAVGPTLAWLVAASFAVHPQHVESVAWVSDRKDLLAALWALVTLASWGRWVAQGQLEAHLSPGGQRAAGAARGPSWYLLSLLAFLACLLSKASLVTLPLVLLVADAWPLQRLREGAGGWRQRVAEKLPFVLLALPFPWITHYAQQQLGAVVSDGELPLPLRLGNAVVGVATYAGKTLWPSDLAVHYPHPGPALQWPLVWLAASALVLVSALAWRFRRAVPAVAVGWFCYLLLVAPVAGVVQLGSAARADRFTYVPLIPLLLAVFAALQALAARWSLPVAVVRGAAGLAVVAQAAVSWAVLPAWQDTESLMRRATQVTQGNALAHYDLGMALEKRGDAVAAQAQYQLAYLANPLDSRANNKLGNLAMAAKEPSKAMVFYQTALRADPADLGIAANLTIAQELAGDLAGAEAGLRALLQRQPADGAARLRLAHLLLRQHRAPDAELQYAAALAQEPANALVMDGLGNALWIQGKKGLAQQHWRRARQELAKAGPSDLLGKIDQKLKLAQASEAGPSPGAQPSQPAPAAP